MRRRSITDSSFALIALTGIRLALGIFWLSQLAWKQPPTFGCPDQGLCLWIDRAIQSPALPAYATFLRTVVAPHVVIFGWFVDVVEAFTGVSLLLGFFTRLGAPYYCFHDVDAMPAAANIKEHVANFALTVDRLEKKQAETGIKLLWGTANLF